MGGRTADAITQYQQAHDLYVGTVGTSSPLFCSAAEGLAKALKVEGRHDEASEALLQAFQVHARGDAVHPTPLFEHLETALEIHDRQPSVSLDRFTSLIDDAIENLDSRGLAEDGNAGLVMSRAAKLLARIGGELHLGRAEALARRCRALTMQARRTCNMKFWRRRACW